VESLLIRGDQAGSFLETPAMEATAMQLTEATTHSSQSRRSEPEMAVAGASFTIGQAVSHYRIESKLGEGGMGVVYKARDTHLDRFVAIKILPAEAAADPERKRRFAQETKAASALNHPNILHVYDIDAAGPEGRPVDFIAMEYVDGKTLEELIGRKGLPVRETLKYAVQIADGLSTAHAAGIAHRDIKPGNIMVNDKGLIKILDFGLAKLSDSRHRGMHVTEAGRGEELAAAIREKSNLLPVRRPPRHAVLVNVVIPRNAVRVGPGRGKSIVVSV